MIFRQWALRPDSAGPGTHRGGLGAVYDVDVMTDAEVSLLGERGKAAPFGVAGGGEAAPTRFSWASAAGELTSPMVAKITGVAMARSGGGRVRLKTPGGGGWSDPAARAPAAVARDVRLGFVSAEEARATYHVALAVDGTADEAATAAARREHTA